MPVFINNPNDPPTQRMLDKLVAAGWASFSLKTDKPKESDPHGAEVKLPLTEKGRERLRDLFILFREIEQVSGKLQDDELPWLRAFAESAAMLKGGSEPPSRR